MSIRFVRTVALMLAASLLNLSLVQAASASVIGTGEAIQTAARAERLSAVEAVLTRADVQSVLVAYGVSVDDAMARVAALNEEELLALEQQFDQLPAGGIGIFEVLGITFLVLLILELTGVINIFAKF